MALQVRASAMLLLLIVGITNYGIWLFPDDTNQLPEIRPYCVNNVNVYKVFSKWVRILVEHIPMSSKYINKIKLNIYSV